MNELPIGVLSLGEFLIDLIATDGAPDLQRVESLAVKPGGAPANAAVALRRLGIEAAFAGVVGSDPFGERLLDLLDREGVGRTCVRQSAEADTTLAFAWKDSSGDGHFRLTRMADVLLSPEDIDAASIGTRKAIVVGSVALSAEPSRDAVHHAVEIANNHGVPVVFDVNIRPTLWPDRETALDACLPVLNGSSLLKLSLDDAEFLFEPDGNLDAIVQALQSSPARFLVITGGSRGAWFTHLRGSRGSELTFVPAYSVDAVEPTGAGDAFTAGLVSRLMSRDWERLDVADVQFASAAGALATTRHGALEGLPSAEEVERFLERQNGPAE